MLAFNNLMTKKGYKFVTSVADNLIYVINEDFSKLNIDEISGDIVLSNYFCPNKYWGELYRDKYNNEWIIMDNIA